VVSDFPVVEKEVAEAIHGVGADAREDVAEVAEGVDLDSFEADDDTTRDRCGVPTSLAHEEQPRAAAQRAGGHAPSTPLLSNWA